MTVSHIHSLRKLNQNANDISFYYYDEEESKRAIEEEIKLSKFHKAMQAHTIRHLTLSELEQEGLENSKKDFRSLEESNLFDDVAIVDPNKDSFYWITRWISANLKQFSSSIVVYPYPYEYSPDDSPNSTITYKQGSYISLNPAELNAYNIGLKTNKTLSIQKARALFGTDIAILSVEGTFEDDDIIDYFYDGTDWCTYFANLGKGNCFGNFDAFYNQKTKNTQNTYVTKINETDLANGKLMTNDLPSFRILIIPDFLYGAYERLKNKLGSSGLAKIKDFFDKGGVIFATGKSGIILEDAKIVKDGTYDRTKLLSVENNDRKTVMTGCEGIYNDNINDFEKHLACLTVSTTTKVGLSTTFLTKTPDPGFTTLININPAQKDLSVSKTDDFVANPIEEGEKKYLPLVSYRSNQKDGYVFLMNFNPMLSGGNTNIVFNLLALAMSKELYLTSKVNMALNSTITDLPIPAGEAGVNLQVKTTIHNLNDEPVTECNLYVFLPDNFGWTKTPDKCELRESTTISSLPKSVLQKKLIQSSNKYLFCEIGNIEKFEKKDFLVTISALNYKATQTKNNVRILEPIAFLKSQTKEITLVDYVSVNCEAAPLLRVAASPDPSAFYPVYGEGEYVDNVIKIENKEETNALEVEYVGLIPVVTPLLDGDDQRKTDWALKIYVDYYNNDFDFEVPFTSENATDYIYTAYLQGKGSVIAAEWDSPVLPVKELIDADMLPKVGDGIKQDVNISGINRGMITINKTSEVLKQVKYSDSSRFYKLASQRLMVFIDDSTPEGAKTLYKGNIPEEWKDPVYKDRAKREFLFLRNDIYFYENENYCNPPNATEKIVFSIDKLVEYKKNNPNCKRERGKASSTPISEGYFDNHEDAHRKKILEPTIYSNELFDYCDLEVVDPTNETSIKEQFGDLNHFRPVHYIIPNVEENVTQATQIYNFKSDTPNSKSGYHQIYNSIRFIYLHSATIKIDAKTCLYGGKIIVSLGNLILNNVDDVTVSPDQIAVFKTENVNNQILIYFRRGLMSNEQFGKDLTIGINIENLSSEQDLKLDLEIEQMIYDISIPELEKYENVVNKYQQTFKYTSAFSYPALEVKTKLDRDLNGYETMEPFSRYGTYSQDIEHRYIWGTAETHHTTHPGVTGSTGGFSIISNLGISSIPFIEYVTVGKGQVIPAGTSTARATWKDIWGRTWHQPIRSLFPDVPPIPPPLKNFMMSTTYEILKGENQIYEWNSDEEVYIHLHIKLLNNYPKYFEITRCKENEILFVPKTVDEEHDRVYSNTSSVKIGENDIKNEKNTFLRQGGFASYGVCFSTDGAYVGGQKVEGDFRNQIERAKVCADFTDENMIAQCFNELENITTLHKVTKEDKSKGYTKWNYSPRVENYYPTNYIEEDMWDLTHIDYDDNAMDKAYKYHMDNHLPNYDNKIIKPHNTIAIPIYKGLGYNITYDKEYQIKYHGTNKKGWWCDNLQNRDDTLVAGQDVSNEISVNKPFSINNWVKGKDLVGINDDSNKNVKDIIEKRNKNIYVCLYNQKRPQFNKKNTKKYAALNVNQNNVVPVLVNLEKDDPRLYSYECNQEQIEPDDLRNVEGNLLATPTSKDYLYFAANLRGQAKEAFNVVMKLQDFKNIKYEGMVKVNEGGRFVYWNPANGPNSFLVVDNPVSIINAKRNDIEVYNILFPQKIKTFNSTVYHQYTFRDVNKINKTWPFEAYYTNSYGFGDLSISVYVGGIRKSKAVINKNETTYARIIINNNCGYDLKMKVGAIEDEEIAKKAISAYDLLEGLVHTIKKPTKYNFLISEVEDKYKPYIDIEPSDHNINVPAEFFDFENINVATIRDGFKGEYNLKIYVNSTLPSELTGKPIEIKLKLNTSYFEHFPGTETDLIQNYHKYTKFSLPSVYIAVPYDHGDFKGKVLYTSAYASNLDFSIQLSSDWDILGVKYVDNKTLDEMLIALQGEDVANTLNKKWDELKTNTVNYVEEFSGFNKVVKFTGFNQNITQFPIPKGSDPDVAEVSILLKTRVKQIVKGTTYPLLNTVKLSYKDWTNKTKNTKGLNPFVEASGPWVTLYYTKTLMEQLPNGTYVPAINQELTHTDEGIMQIYFRLTNSGNGDAFNTTYSILLDSNITYISCKGVEKVSSKEDAASKTTELTFDLKSGIPAGQAKGGYIYVKYNKLIESYTNLTPEELKGLPTTLQVANQSETNLKVTNDTNAEYYTQVIRTPISFKYQNNNLLPYLDLIVSGRRSNPTIEVVPKINKANNPDCGDIITNISKVDMTEYENEIYRLNQTFKPEYLIKNKIKFDNPEDKPITQDYDYKKHVVMYSLSIKASNKFTQNKLAYKQEDIGISTAEVVLIIISIVFFALAGFFIWAGVKNMKLIKNHGGEDILGKEVKSSNLDKLLNEE